MIFKGHPSGEAFIQLDSEQAAAAAASDRHNKYMQIGKKQRYIEVFQCSADDMNLVLTGPSALPTSLLPAAAACHARPMISPGMKHIVVSANCKLKKTVAWLFMFRWKYLSEFCSAGRSRFVAFAVFDATIFVTTTNTRRRWRFAKRSVGSRSSGRRPRWNPSRYIRWWQITNYFK